MKTKNIHTVFGFLLMTVFFTSSAYADSCIRHYKTTIFDNEKFPGKLQLYKN
ncbi:MAG: hypothetical protein K8H86_02965 [Ignavibacteriaceae bacterium]|nr:hypothetical protein [Ignavibacteriaceae bacterium]